MEIHVDRSLGWRRWMCDAVDPDNDNIVYYSAQHGAISIRQHKDTVSGITPRFKRKYRYTVIQLHDSLFHFTTSKGHCIMEEIIFLKVLIEGIIGIS